MKPALTAPLSPVPAKHLTGHTPRSVAPVSLLLNLLFDLLHVHLSPLAITAVSKRQMLNHFFLGGVKVYTVLLPLGLSVT